MKNLATVGIARPNWRRAWDSNYEQTPFYVSFNTHKCYIFNTSIRKALSYVLFFYVDVCIFTTKITTKKGAIHHRTAPFTQRKNYE